MQYLGVPEKKIRVIRWGIDPSLKPTKNKEVSSYLRVGFLGMLDKRKRIELLIKAFKSRKFEKATLSIGGRGLEENRLKELAGGEVNFKGYIQQKDIAGFYNDLDLFIFPSALEGYGLPIVEAMACGLPVVVLADSKIPKEIKSRCIVVASLSEIFTDLGRTLTLIKYNNTESNLKFAQHHDWVKCAKEYLEVYKEVASES